MTPTTESLIERLRATLSWLPGTQIVIDTMQEAAAALEARDRRIAELERTQYGSGILEQLRAKLDKAEEKCDALEATVRQYVRNFNEVEDERNTLRAQLSELQSGDELPELPPIPFIQIEENLRQWAQSYARQAQAMARAKMLAELGKQTQGEDWSREQRHALNEGACAIRQLIREGCWAEQSESIAATLDSIRPLPAQDVNAELAYNKVDRFLRNNLGDDDYAEYSEALDALANAKAEQQKGGV